MISTNQFDTQNFRDQVVELIRLAATDLPADVEQRLKQASRNEAAESPAQQALTTILKNVQLAREKSCPMCQDTGTPIFFVQLPGNLSQNTMKRTINEAVSEATNRNYLRPNAVHPITGVNSGNNIGDHHFPVVNFEESDDDKIIVDLLLKGGGCENVGGQYALPDDSLNAERNLEGVRKVVLDAVYKAQGLGCAPGVLGVVIGGDRSSAYAESKRVFLSRLGCKNEDRDLQQLEDQIFEDANQLGIGPMGFGGKTTLLGVKISALYTLPASYFVTVSYMCWAYRRRRMVIGENKVNYE